MTHAGERMRSGYRALVSRLGRRRGAGSTERYERAALEEIDRIKNPPPSRLGSALDAIHRPIASAAGAVLENPVGGAFSKGVEDLMSVLDQGAAWSVRPDAVLEQLRSRGHPGLHDRRDIHRLDLRDVDDAVGRLAAKYKSLAFAEGASTGFFGLAGTAVDIPGLVTIALRATSEYAVHYGFDPCAEDERAFMLMLLSVASALTVEERQGAMAALTELTRMFGEGDSRAESRRLIGMRIATQVAHVVGSRLAGAGAASAVPVFGAGIAGAFNAWFLKTLTETAHQLYRERFLVEKHGPGVVVPVRV
jgi:hypothetical protein